MSSSKKSSFSLQSHLPSTRPVNTLSGHARKAALTVSKAAMNIIAKPLPVTVSNNLAATQQFLTPISATQGLVRSETVVNINRGKYEEVMSKIVGGSRGEGFVLAGPTGCGKSTFALVPLMTSGTTMLMLQPTRVNCGNVLNEWNNIMRSAVPSLTKHFAYAMPEHPNGWITCTTPMFNAWCSAHGRLPNVNYICLDEYHIANQETVTALELLRNLDFAGKYILISATPPGIRVPPRSTLGGIVSVDDYVPDPMTLNKIENTVYDPARYRELSFGTTCVFVQNNVAAAILHQLYKNAGYDTYIVNDRTDVESFKTWMNMYSVGDIFILTPDVQAGITIPMSVLILGGRTVSISYDGSVLAERMRVLMRDEREQALGRAARVYPTVVISSSSSSGSAPSSDLSYYRANVAVILRALNIDLKLSTVKEVVTNYPSVGRLTQTAASKAVQIDRSSPFTALFYMTPAGVLYDFVGGPATTFVQDHVDSLKLFVIGKDTFVAPMLNMTVDADPSKWLDRQLQQRMCEAIAVSRAVPMSSDLLELADVLVQEFDFFADDLLTLLTTMQHGVEGFRTFMDATEDLKKKTDTELDALWSKTSLHLKTLVGEAGAKFLTHLADKRVIILYDTRTYDRSLQPLTMPDGKLRVPSFVRLDKYFVRFIKSGKTFSLGAANPACKSNGYLDEKKIESFLVDGLRGFLAAAWLKNKGGGAVVDLKSYRNEATSSGHSWTLQRLT